jgi:hypothetical protein
VHRHLGGEPPAERAADHDDLAAIVLGEPVEIEIGEIVDRVGGRGVRGMAEPGMGGRAGGHGRRADRAREPPDRDPLHVEPEDGHAAATLEP